MLPNFSFTDFSAAMIERHFSITSPASIQTYLGALVFLSLIFVLRRKAVRSSLRGFWRALFPAKIFQHKSTRVDMKHYAFNAVLLSSAYGSVLATSEFWFHGTQKLLDALHVTGPLIDAPVGVVMAITALVELAMLELAYWTCHFLMHRIPVLWEFHKVHHSAEVLTPLTEWRQHPVEMILNPNTISLFVGVSYGVLFRVFGGAQPLSLFGVNVFLLTFTMTILHLRHSHVWLPFTGLAGRILQSPAHHQIHHSTNPKHFNKNLGFGMSIWDWAFGTLFIPEKRERLEFGLGEETAYFDTAHGTLVRPFVKAAEHMRVMGAQSLAAGGEIGKAT